MRRSGSRVVHRLRPDRPPVPCGGDGPLRRKNGRPLHLSDGIRYALAAVFLLPGARAEPAAPGAAVVLTAGEAYAAWAAAQPPLSTKSGYEHQELRLRRAGPVRTVAVRGTGATDLPAARHTLSTPRPASDGDRTVPRHTRHRRSRTDGRRGLTVGDGWCPEPDLNRHAREGAARFKLAVSAFHHPGRPWGPRWVSEPIGMLSPGSGRVESCCLISWVTDEASAPRSGHRHLPAALWTAADHVRGMTEFHPPNQGAPPVPNIPGRGTRLRGGRHSQV